MFVNGSKKQKIDFLNDFYKTRYQERNFKFRPVEINSNVNSILLEEMIHDISRYTEFRAMKFYDKEGVYFVICKL